MDNKEFIEAIKSHQEGTNDLPNLSHINISDCLVNELNLDYKAFVQNHFTDSVFRKVSFYDSHLTQSQFSGCNFYKSYFSEAGLHKTVFSNCTFIDCSFVKVDLLETSIIGCSFYGCDFKLFDADSGIIKDSKLYDPQNLPVDQGDKFHIIS